MIHIKNQTFKEEVIENNHIFIYAMGYESRSTYLWKKTQEKVSFENKYVFVFNDFDQHNIDTKLLVKKIEKNKLAQIKNIEYEQGMFFQETIQSILLEKQKEMEEVVIHIDYSSMPRSWYFALPYFLERKLRVQDKIIFWYVAGIYPSDYENSFDAGINSFKTFGAPSLWVEKRQHVFSLSYDKVRTQAILSLLDPDGIIVCHSCDPFHKAVSDNVKKLNEHIVAQASMVFTLKINDFEFMISKLSEIALEYIKDGDVVFVPDGPKPIIFAMSIIPFYLNKIGVSCLQVTRNDLMFTPVDVEPTDTIFGVEFYKN